MKSKIIFNLILFVITLLISENSIAQEDQCNNCHMEMEDNPSSLFQQDIHFKKGISCSGCHGGNSKSDDADIAMNKNNGFIGVPSGDKISLICSNCHSDSLKMRSYNSSLPTNQYQLLTTSVHNKISLDGKERILQCSTCHNAHGIKSVKDPKSTVYSLNIVKICINCHSNATYMRSYNPSIAIDQYQKYLSSVHGKLNKDGDPKAAECSDCHGSHDIRAADDVRSKVYSRNIPSTCSNCHSNKEYMKTYKIPTDQYEKYANDVHGKALLEKNDPSAPACNDCHGNHAATPPGVESISNVCGNCHVLNAQLFSQSPHKQAFDRNNYPECETCHGNHGIISATDNLLGVGPNAVCSKCHTELKNVKGFKIAKQMRSMVDSLNTLNLEADTLIDEAEQKGMEISEAKFKLSEATHAKLEVKTIVHAFDLIKFKNIIDEKGIKITKDVITEANASIHEFYFRRLGLGISILIISFLAFTLFLYIRKIEKKL
jgi:predicted CXXCH cytochrome family protein